MSAKTKNNDSRGSPLNPDQEEKTLRVSVVKNWMSDKKNSIPILIILGLTAVNLVVWEKLTSENSSKLAELSKNSSRFHGELLARELDHLKASLTRMGERDALYSKNSETVWQADAKNYLRDNASLMSLVRVSKGSHKTVTFPASASFAMPSLEVLSKVVDKPKFTFQKSDSKNIIQIIVPTLNSSGPIHWIVAHLDINKKLESLVTGYRYGFEISIYGNTIFNTVENSELSFLNIRAAGVSIDIHGLEFRVLSVPVKSTIESYQNSFPTYLFVICTFLILFLGRSMQLFLLYRESLNARITLASRLQSILNFAPIGILKLDSLDRTVFANSSLCKIFGRSQEELLLCSWTKWIYPSDLEWVLSKWNLSKIKQEEFRETFRLLLDGSKTIWVTVTSAMLKASDGTVDRRILAILEITSEKSMEESLRNDKRFIEAVIDNLPVALFCKDFQNDLRFSLWNKHAEKIWGWNSQNIVGKSDYDLFSQNEADFFRKKDLETLKNGSIVDINEETLTTADGSKMLLRTRKVPILDSEGRAIQLLGISEDITKTKEAEKTIEEQRIKIVRNDRIAALGEMAAGMSHEINNPLSIIQASIDQMLIYHQRTELTDERIEKTIRRISQTTQRISSIIKGLRAFAREGVNEPFENVKVSSLISDTLEFCQARFGFHSVKLKVPKVDNTLTIDCRRTQIGQVLLNVLNNAFDAVVQTKDPTIEINVINQSYSVEIWITDSGTAISKEVSSKLLNPFYTTKPVGMGMGLGLSIADGIMKSHEGELIHDQESKNTRFKIILRKFLNTKSNTFKHASMVQDSNTTQTNH